MGCDIHYVVEMKVGDRWVAIMTTECAFHPEWDKRPSNVLWQFVARDYAFFANLAGVRGDGPEPNGPPEDASETTQALIEYWDGDGHSLGHCPLYDFAAAKLRAAESRIISEAVLNTLEGVNPVFKMLNIESYIDINNYRVCFWFDN